ncbi:hypothetical protein HDU86_002558 [Geranomyces michiganensis]|nr:hypothetical protein HDU86_002558 [Geranomyces michiganensis]
MTPIPHQKPRDDYINALAAALSSLAVVDDQKAAAEQNSLTHDRDTERFPTGSWSAALFKIHHADSDAISAAKTEVSQTADKLEAEPLPAAEEQGDVIADIVEDLTICVDEIDLTSADDGAVATGQSIPCFSAANIPAAFLGRLDADTASKRQTKHAKAARAWPGPASMPILHISNVPVTRGQMTKLLQRASWLDDESVNGYFALMQARFPETLFLSTHFYPSLTGDETNYEFLAVARWTKRWPRGIFSFERAVVPINRGNLHWCLVAIDLLSGRLHYYDSMKPADSYARKVLETIERYLCDERADKLDEPDAPPLKWTHHVEPCPQQEDGGSCGVFTCLFAKRFALRRPMTFTQALVDRFRVKLAWDLVGLLQPGKPSASKAGGINRNGP